MTQSERREKSRAAILEAALAEFGERGYAAASVDGVCARGGISKGLMYHYYKGKDELFCECVRAMFAALAEHLGGYLGHTEHAGAEELLSGYFLSRERFSPPTAICVPCLRMRSCARRRSWPGR